MKMKSYREELRESLARLAAPASEQTSYLKGLLSYPLVDELALDLHEVALLADERFLQGKLSQEERDAIKDVDAKLDAISGSENAHLWTPEALSKAPEWQAIRDLAAHVLELMSGGSGRGEGREGVR